MEDNQRPERVLIVVSEPSFERRYNDSGETFSLALYFFGFCIGLYLGSRFLTTE